MGKHWTTDARSTGTRGLQGERQPLPWELTERPPPPSQSGLWQPLSRRLGWKQRGTSLKPCSLQRPGGPWEETPGVLETPGHGLFHLGSEKLKSKEQQSFPSYFSTLPSSAEICLFPLFHTTACFILSHPVGAKRRESTASLYP